SSRGPDRPPKAGGRARRGIERTADVRTPITSLSRDVPAFLKSILTCRSTVPYSGAESRVNENSPRRLHAEEVRASGTGDARAGVATRRRARRRSARRAGRRRRRAQAHEGERAAGPCPARISGRPFMRGRTATPEPERREPSRAGDRLWTADAPGSAGEVVEEVEGRPLRVVGLELHPAARLPVGPGAARDGERAVLRVVERAFDRDLPLGEEDRP